MQFLLMKLKIIKKLLTKLKMTKLNYVELKLFLVIEPRGVGGYLGIENRLELK